MRKTKNPVVIAAFPKCINKTFFPVKTKFQPDRPPQSLKINTQQAAAAALDSQMSASPSAMYHPWCVRMRTLITFLSSPKKGKHHAHSKKQKNKPSPMQASARCKGFTQLTILSRLRPHHSLLGGPFLFCALSLNYTYTSPSMTASLCLTALAFFDMPAAFLRCFLAAGAPVASTDMGVAAPEGSADASSN